MSRHVRSSTKLLQRTSIRYSSRSDRILYTSTGAIGSTDRQCYMTTWGLMPAARPKGSSAGSAETLGGWSSRDVPTLATPESCFRQNAFLLQTVSVKGSQHGLHAVSPPPIVPRLNMEGSAFCKPCPTISPGFNGPAPQCYFLR